MGGGGGESLKNFSIQSLRRYCIGLAKSGKACKTRKHKHGSEGASCGLIAFGTIHDQVKNITLCVIAE